MKRTKSIGVLPLLVVAACAGSGDGDLDLESRDPRCVSACTQAEPRYANAGEVCNTASREQCLDECETRIADLATVCQNCLLEEACFGPDGCYGSGPTGGSCYNNTCTISSEFGSCTFDSTNESQKQKCYEQVDPRREVTCTSEFRSSTECASVCVP
jgi:hypothetical protein